MVARLKRSIYLCELVLADKTLKQTQRAYQLSRKQTLIDCLYAYRYERRKFHKSHRKDIQNDKLFD